MEDKVKGRIEEAKGKLTGDRVEETKGKGRQIVGEAKRLNRDARDEASPEKDESDLNEADGPQ